MHKDGSGQVMLHGPCMGHGCPWSTGLGGRGGVSAALLLPVGGSPSCHLAPAPRL